MQAKHPAGEDEVWHIENSNLLYFKSTAQELQGSEQCCIWHDQTTKIK